MRCIGSKAETMQKLKGVTNEAMYIYTQNKLNIIGVNERSKFSIDTSQQGLPRLVVYEDGVKNVLGVYLPNEAMTILKQLLQALSEGQASYEMPISSRFSNGYPLSSNDVQRITAKLSITTHARHRMIERGLFSADISPEKMKESVILYIRNSFCSFYNTDGSVTIGVDNTHYFIIDYDYLAGGYSVRTYAEESAHGYSVSDKRRKARGERA